MEICVVVVHEIKLCVVHEIQLSGDWARGQGLDDCCCWLDQERCRLVDAGGSAFIIIVIACLLIVWSVL